MNIFLLLSIIFCHILDDFCFQGWLASAKQKEWWEKNAPEPLYRFDYICALIMHSASWSFVITVPLKVYSTAMHFGNGWILAIMFLVNATIHAIIDDLKANKKKINLVIDQSLHIIQILITFIVYYFIFK